MIKAAIRAHVQKAIDDEEQNPWKAAIIQELIVDNILTEELERDPHKALAAAIDWNCKVALDPSVSKEAQDLQQRAIDAALESVAQRLKLEVTSRGYDPDSVTMRYTDANQVEIKAGMADKCYRIVMDTIGTNPLAERAAEYARGIEFRAGQLAERDARIAELESLLAEAYADADDVLRQRIAELERMLSEEPHNIPTKYVQHGGVTFALHGSSSIQAYEELERELAEARKDAERYRWLRDEAFQATAARIVQMLPGHMDAEIDSAMNGANGFLHPRPHGEA